MKKIILILTLLLIPLVYAISDPYPDWECDDLFYTDTITNVNFYNGFTPNIGPIWAIKLSYIGTAILPNECPEYFNGYCFLEPDDSYYEYTNLDTSKTYGITVYRCKEIEDCTPFYTTGCYNGDLCWYDSCGNRGICEECESGQCENKACIPSIIPKKCTDTDNGYEIYTKGTTKLGTAENTDYCISDIKLQEYYCIHNENEDDNVASISGDCPYKGCVDGACLRKEEPPITIYGIIAGAIIFGAIGTYFYPGLGTAGGVVIGGLAGYLIALI